MIPRTSYSLPLIYFVTILVLLLFRPILEVQNIASLRIYETVKINVFVNLLRYLGFSMHVYQYIALEKGFHFQGSPG